MGWNTKIKELKKSVFHVRNGKDPLGPAEHENGHDMDCDMTNEQAQSSGQHGVQFQAHPSMGQPDLNANGVRDDGVSEMAQAPVTMVGAGAGPSTSLADSWVQGESRFCPMEMRRVMWRVEDFTVQKRLYEGYSSSVSQAYDMVSKTVVALKIYSKAKLSELNRAQVEREIRIHLDLQHMHIIMLYAAWQDETAYYLVQEFAAEGDVFSEVHRRGGQLSEKAAVSLVLQPFLAALHYLHTKDIIHRDIKPENLLFTQGKQMKVADFGLAINQKEERPVTRAGTLDYMAPEVVVCPSKKSPNENKEKVNLGYSEQVDAWSVGILAYELIVGFPPFERESRAATLESIIYSEPQFPVWMSEDAVDFIKGALCKDQKRRPSIPDMLRHPWIQIHERRRSHRTIPTEFLWKGITGQWNQETGTVQGAPPLQLRQTTTFGPQTFCTFDPPQAPVLPVPGCNSGASPLQRSSSNTSAQTTPGGMQRLPPGQWISPFAAASYQSAADQLLPDAPSWT